MRLTVVINPAAGGGTGRRRGRKAHALLGTSTIDRVIETRSMSHAEEAVRDAIREGTDAVVAIGGDGIVHAVANAICQSPTERRPPLAVIPCGRGNDFARTLGVSDVETACAAIVRGTPRRIDVGRTDGRFFLGVAGAGFDSRVARRAQQGIPLLSGAAVYVYSVLRTLTTFEPVRARVTYEHGDYEGPITFIAVGNSGRYGGGMRIAPLASLEDGLLDLCLVKDVTRTTLLRMLPRVFDGSHLQHPRVIYAKCRWVTIDAEQPLEVFADGEFMQRVPVRIEVLAGALDVLVPDAMNR